jgi:hypothetical protein
VSSSRVDTCFYAVSDALQEVALLLVGTRVV